MRLGPGLKAGLLFGGALGGRHDLETLVWERVAAFDRESVRSCGESLLSSLDGGKLEP